jgi:protein phosphatase
MISEPSARQRPLDHPHPGLEAGPQAESGMGQELRWVAAACSQPGAHRGSNQDSHRTGETVAVLADGMGGVRGGALASATAVEAVYELLSVDSTAVSTERLRRCIRSAHERVRMAASASQCPGMGTTLTVAAFTPGSSHLLIAHCGDSRAYLLRGSRLVRLTRDHVRRWVDPGGVTRTGLTRCVGGSGDTAQPDIAEVAIRPGDRVLLCSDGLYGCQRDEELGAVLRDLTNPAQCSVQLVRAAVSAGAVDDITAVVCDVA